MNNIKEIIKQIEEKEQEIQKLNDQLIDLEKQKYTHIIGKCYKFFSTSYIMVKDIVNVDSTNILVECIYVYDRDSYPNELNIDLNYFCKLSHKEFRNGIIKEISTEEFTDCVVKALEATKTELLKSINDNSFFDVT